MSQWVSELKAEKKQLRQMIALRGLADYIAMSYTPSEQDELIARLQDPTKRTKITIEVTDITNPERSAGT